MTADSTTSPVPRFCLPYIRTLVDSTLTTNVALDGCQGQKKIQKMQRYQSSGGSARKKKMNSDSEMKDDNVSQKKRASRHMKSALKLPSQHRDGSASRKATWKSMATARAAMDVDGCGEEARAAPDSPLKRDAPEAVFDALSMKMLSCNNVWLSMLPAENCLCDYVEIGMNSQFRHWLEPKVQTALTEGVEPEFECLRWNVAVINGAKMVPTVKLMDPSVAFHSKANTYVAIVTLMDAITLHSL